jgi:hypothetical protein
MRDGWGEEDGAYVHLASEMAVVLDEYHGDWVIEDVAGGRHGYSFQDPEVAMDEVDTSFASNPRHALEWS